MTGAQTHTDAHGANLLLQYDDDIARAIDQRRTRLSKQDRRADSRMSGEGNLALRREDSHARRVRRILRLQHEDRFREVQLAGDCLHLIGAEGIGIADDGKRIAAEAAVGEDIERVQRQGHLAIVHVEAGALCPYIEAGQAGTRVRITAPCPRACAR